MRTPYLEYGRPRSRRPPAPAHPRTAHARRPTGTPTAPTPQYACPPQQYTFGRPAGHLAPATAKRETGRNPVIAVVATVVLGALAGGGVFLALSGRNDDKNDASQSQGTGEDTGDQGPAASDPDVLNSVRAVARTDPYGVNLPATLGVRPTTVGQRPAPRRARGRALLRSVGQTRVTGSGEDPRTTELRAAVARLRRELAGHPPEFPDRDIAEDELAVLAAMVAAGDPEVPRMRRSLLLIAGAIGSVSALAPALMQVRNAMDLFGEVPR